MPSQKVLEAKQQEVAALADRLGKSVAGVLVDYKGINVADDTALRKELREAGIEYAVSKNSLLALAVKGTSLEGLSDVLKGMTAVATSESDHVAAARILNKFAGAHPNFTIKSGFIDGEVIDAAKVESLAKLPSKEQLIATLAATLNEPVAMFARALQAVVDKGDAAPAAAE